MDDGTVMGLGALALLAIVMLSVVWSIHRGSSIRTLQKRNQELEAMLKGMVTLMEDYMYALDSDVSHLWDYILSKKGTQGGG